MNNLQKLLKLRGLPASVVAKQIGAGYHNTQKIIKKLTIRRVDGSERVRSNRIIEEGVAKLLGLTHDEAWGPESDIILQRFIGQELSKLADKREQELRKQWLLEDSVLKKRAVGNV
jgi:hypothetical protein